MFHKLSAVRRDRDGYPAADRLREDATWPSASRCRTSTCGCPTPSSICALPRPRPRSATALVILGHHYQRDEVIKFADRIGDSLKLAQYAAAQHAGRVRRLLRRPLHGRERRRARRAASARDPAGPGRRLLDGRHGRDRSARSLLGRTAHARRRPSVDSGHLHQLHRRHQSASAASTAASSARRATRRRSMAWAWDRGEKLLMLPDQHLGRNTAYRDGRAARRDGACGIRICRLAASTPTTLASRAARSCGRATAASTRASRSKQIEQFRDDASGRQGHRASRVHVRRRPGRRRVRVDRAHHPHGQGEPGGIGLGRRDRDPPRQPAGARGRARPHRADARRARAACARRCSACRRIICCGCSKAWSTARCTTRSSCPSRRRRWRAASRLDRMLRTALSLSEFRHEESCHVPSASVASVRRRRARAAHRRADDADSSRQASRGVREQPERRAREASRAAGQERRGSHQEPVAPCPRTSAPPSATTAAGTSTTRCSGRSWAPARAARRPARSPQVIDDTFGGFDAFKEQMNKAGVGRFGSGWVWLVDAGGKLAIESTANQDNPMMDGKTADLRHRRLGTRLLPEVPEPPARLPRGLVERRSTGTRSTRASSSGGAPHLREHRGRNVFQVHARGPASGVRVAGQQVSDNRVVPFDGRLVRGLVLVNAMARPLHVPA